MTDAAQLARPRELVTIRDAAAGDGDRQGFVIVGRGATRDCDLTLGRVLAPESPPRGI